VAIAISVLSQASEGFDGGFDRRSVGKTAKFVPPTSSLPQISLDFADFIEISVNKATN